MDKTRFNSVMKAISFKGGKRSIKQKETTLERENPDNNHLNPSEEDSATNANSNTPILAPQSIFDNT